MFAALYGRPDWEAAVTETGLFATYNAMFGYPFDLAIEPLVPTGVRQPPMQLPFEQGQDWAYTGGPHGGWDSGSAWAALDFAPPIDALGCVQSDVWVVAVAVVFAALGFAADRDLNVQTDIEKLIPTSTPGVVALNQARSVVGGSVELPFLIQAPDVTACL